MKKLIKPEIVDLENVEAVRALCEICDCCYNDGFCDGHWWADDDKDEILF